MTGRHRAPQGPRRRTVWTRDDVAGTAAWLLAVALAYVGGRWLS